MKLTKGKISKLYSKNRQSVKRRKNGKNKTNKSKTFGRKRNVNLANKSLKQVYFRKNGGNNIVPEYDNSKEGGYRMPYKKYKKNKPLSIESPGIEMTPLGESVNNPLQNQDLAPQVDNSSLIAPSSENNSSDVNAGLVQPLGDVSPTVDSSIAQPSELPPADESLMQPSSDISSVDSSVEQPSGDIPLADESLMQPSSDVPAVDSSIAQPFELPPADSSIEQPSGDILPADESLMQPSSDILPADSSIAQPSELPPADESLMQPSSDILPADSSIAQPSELPPADESLMQPSEDVPAVDSSIAQPSEVVSPAVDESLMQPSEDVPAVDSSLEQPSGDLPAVDEVIAQPSEVVSPAVDEVITQPSESVPPVDDIGKSLKMILDYSIDKLSSNLKNNDILQNGFNANKTAANILASSGGKRRKTRKLKLTNKNKKTRGKH